MPAYGRIPRKTDSRDYRLMDLQRVLEILPPPTPGPTLDQGTQPACVAFSGTHGVNSTPFAAKPSYGSADALALYAALKNNDGMPNQPGSDNRTLGRMLKEWKKISGYAFATNAGEIRSSLQTLGPGVFGTPWTVNMEKADANGVVRYSPTDRIAGGHDILALYPQEKVPGYGLPGILFQNSWSEDWGIRLNVNGRMQGGFCYMLDMDIAQLFLQQADFIAFSKMETTHDAVPDYGPLPVVDQGSGCAMLAAAILVYLSRGTSQARPPR